MAFGSETCPRINRYIATLQNRSLLSDLQSLSSIERKEGILILNPLCETTFQESSLVIKEYLIQYSTIQVFI